MKPTKEIEKLLPSPCGSEPAGMPGHRPRTRADAPVKAFRVSKPARLPKYLGPDFLAVLFPENNEPAPAEIPRVPAAAEEAKATRNAGPKSLGKVSWDVYAARSPRSLALALLLD
jgi:hypothetical protein